MSNYSAFSLNPIFKTDVLGNAPSTEVTKEENNTYKVTGGKADGDNNIYVVNNKGKRTGQVLGKSLTEYSFLDDHGNPVKGATIEPTNTSGINFLNNEIFKNTPSLTDYMSNAKGRELYDFKTRGIDLKPPSMTAAQFTYRGLPFKGVANFAKNDGPPIYASARDFGNLAAGYIAGINGLSWGTARAGFDALQSWQDKGFSTEGQPSQRAQRIGHDIGIKLYNDAQLQFQIKNNQRPIPFGPK